MLDFISLIGVGVLLQTAFIIVEHKQKYVIAVILKGLASCCFIALGILSFSILKEEFLIDKPLLLIGLILGGFGDICLNLRFVFTKIGSKIFLLGVASFLAGHILYLIAIINDSTPWIISLIAGVVLAAIILFFIFKTLKVKLSYKIFGILYIGTISIMTAMAVGNLIVDQNTFNIIYVFGAVSFLISDIVLIFNSFGPKPKFVLRITNLSFYYIGQILIALSILFYIS